MANNTKINLLTHNVSYSSVLTRRVMDASHSIIKLSKIVYYLDLFLNCTKISELRIYV